MREDGSGPVVAIVANPSAGGGRAQKAAERAQAGLAARGIRADLAVPASLAALPQEITRLRQDGCAAVLACGGDGTVHQVVQHLQGTDTALGILPAGTGNDIARSIGLPVGDLDACVSLTADLLRASTTRTVDLARLDTHDRTVWAMAVVSIGFDSAVNERADRLQRVPGTLRYVVAVLGELAALRPYEVELVADDVTLRGATTLVAIGNGPTYGGGMRICPDAVLDDGLLDVTWVEAAPRRTILRVFPQIFSGRHVRHPMVRTLRARALHVEAPTAIAYADGERIGVAALRVSSVADALTVLAP